jgi:hypothetical protein
MGIMKQAAVRLEKFDEGVEAAKDSFNAQTALNVALTVSVCLAILVAVVALTRAVKL